MNDLISRQAAISICDNAIDLWNGQLGAGALVAVRDAIMALPSAQPEKRWIPCSERLPSKADHTDDMVLVCYRNGSVRFNTYMNGWVQGNPVAWMPLPKGYKGE